MTSLHEPNDFDCGPVGRLRGLCLYGSTFLLGEISFTSSSALVLVWFGEGVLILLRGVWGWALLSSSYCEGCTGGAGLDGLTTKVTPCCWGLGRVKLKKMGGGADFVHSEAMWTDSSAKSWGAKRFPSIKALRAPWFLMSRTAFSRSWVRCFLIWDVQLSIMASDTLNYGSAKFTCRMVILKINGTGGVVQQTSGVCVRGKHEPITILAGLGSSGAMVRPEREYIMS